MIKKAEIKSNSSIQALTHVQKPHQTPPSNVHVEHIFGCWTCGARTHDINFREINSHLINPYNINFSWNQLVCANPEPAVQFWTHATKYLRAWVWLCQTTYDDVWKKQNAKNNDFYVRTLTNPTKVTRQSQESLYSTSRSQAYSLASHTLALIRSLESKA